MIQDPQNTADDETMRSETMKKLLSYLLVIAMMLTPLRLDESVGRTANFISIGLISNSTYRFAPKCLTHAALNFTFLSANVTNG